jgi:hypothetical protein
MNPYLAISSRLLALDGAEYYWKAKKRADMVKYCQGGIAELHNLRMILKINESLPRKEMKERMRKCPR